MTVERILRLVVLASLQLWPRTIQVDIVVIIDSSVEVLLLLLYLLLLFRGCPVFEPRTPRESPLDFSESMATAVLPDLV